MPVPDKLLLFQAVTVDLPVGCVRDREKKEIEGTDLREGGLSPPGSANTNSNALELTNVTIGFADLVVTSPDAGSP